VQRLKTQLDQYTDLESEQKADIEAVLDVNTHRAFKGVYIDNARELKKAQDTGGPDLPPEVEELDLEMVLFASATIDYDYIMELVAKSDGTAPGKQKMTREQLVSLIASDAAFADQRDLLAAYINQLDLGQGRSKEEIIKGYHAFKIDREKKQIRDLARSHGLTDAALKDFVEEILHRQVFDAERLTDLLAPLDLGWKERSTRERALMADLVPLLKQRALGQPISGLSGYEGSPL
jgi:type I restriction enzyme R subunit